MQPSLLARKTAIPISVAAESMDIEPSHIYLIPGKNNIILKNNKLQLLIRAPLHGLNLPVDLFFASLALEKKKMLLVPSFQVRVQTERRMSLLLRKAEVLYLYKTRKKVVSMRCF